MAKKVQGVPVSLPPPPLPSVSPVTGVCGMFVTMNEPIAIHDDELKSLLHGASVAFPNVPFPGSGLRSRIILSHHVSQGSSWWGQFSACPCIGDLHRLEGYFSGILFRMPLSRDLSGFLPRVEECVWGRTERQCALPTPFCPCGLSLLALTLLTGLDVVCVK